MSPSLPRTAGRDIEEAQTEGADVLRERRAATWGTDALAVAGLLVLGVALPAVVGLWAHSLSIPRDDDWAYRRVLFDFVRTGQYSLVGWGSMTLVGQVLWSAPFVLVLGARPWVPSLAVASLATAGVVAAYLLARGQLGRAKAGGAVLLLVALPGFALSTVDFMTDVPALSAEMVCLLLGAFALRSLGRRQSVWLALSMGAGVFGFSVREFDLAAPGAVLVAMAWSDRPKLKVCATWAAALLVACGAIYLWTAGLPGTQAKALSLPGALSWETLGGGYFTLCFCLSPVLPGALRRSGVSRRDNPPALAALAAACALVVGGLLVTGHHPLFIGNYLDRQGPGGNRVLAGTRPELFPGPFWLGLKVIALGSGAALAAVLGTTGFNVANLRGTSPKPQPQLKAECIPAAQNATREGRLLLVFTLASAAILVGYGLFARAAFWDRYLWPVAFGAAVLMLKTSNGAPCLLGGSETSARSTGAWGKTLRGLVRRAVAGTTALVVGATAVALTLNSDSYDAARWSAGQELVDAGYEASAVDAGFEWVGSHTTAEAAPGRPAAGAPEYEQWYDQMFWPSRVCSVVSASPLLWPSLRLRAILGYSEVFIAFPEHLYIYAVDNPRCKPLLPQGLSETPGQAASQ